MNTQINKIKRLEVNNASFIYCAVKLRPGISSFRAKAVPHVSFPVFVPDVEVNTTDTVVLLQ